MNSGKCAEVWVLTCSTVCLSGAAGQDVTYKFCYRKHVLLFTAHRLILSKSCCLSKLIYVGIFFVLLFQFSLFLTVCSHGFTRTLHVYFTKGLLGEVQQSACSEWLVPLRSHVHPLWERALVPLDSSDQQPEGTLVLALLCSLTSGAPQCSRSVHPGGPRADSYQGTLIGFANVSRMLFAPCWRVFPHAGEQLQAIAS